MSQIKLTTKNNLTNQRFSRLVALTPAFKSARHYIVWNCRCDCGRDHLVSHDNLKGGQVKSCGCLAVDNAKQLHTTHGDSRFRSTYYVWQAMKDRCANPRNRSYKDYGGRGITVYQDWTGEGGYERFRDHIGPRPSLAHTIDRIDNDRGYEPGNVRWATRAEQNRNTRKTLRITHDGRTQSLSEWAREFGVGSGMLWHRVVKKKMPFLDAVTQANQKPKTLVEYNGRQVNIKQLAALTGLSYELLYERIAKDGWAVERAVQPPRKRSPTITLTYKGRTNTLKEWSAAVGIPALTLWSRTMKKGWSTEKALTTPTNEAAFRHPDESLRPR